MIPANLQGLSIQAMNSALGGKGGAAPPTGIPMQGAGVGAPPINPAMHFNPGTTGNQPISPAMPPINTGTTGNQLANSTANYPLPPNTQVIQPQLQGGMYNQMAQLSAGPNYYQTPFKFNAGSSSGGGMNGTNGPSGAPPYPGSGSTGSNGLGGINYGGPAGTLNNMTSNPASPSNMTGNPLNGMSNPFSGLNINPELGGLLGGLAFGPLGALGGRLLGNFSQGPTPAQNALLKTDPTLQAAQNALANPLQPINLNGMPTANGGMLGQVGQPVNTSQFGQGVIGPGGNLIFGGTMVLPNGDVVGSGNPVMTGGPGIGAGLNSGLGGMNGSFALYGPGTEGGHGRV